MVNDDYHDGSSVTTHAVVTFQSSDSNSYPPSAPLQRNTAGLRNQLCQFHDALVEIQVVFPVNLW